MWGSADELTILRRGAGRPDLSILMPLWRRERYVAAAVTSVLAQSDVTAEVIISDDATGDGTLDRALKVVEAYKGPHRVLVRRGRRRLWRDHLPRLADLAGCDVVMQAHDDDISHPARARTVLDVMARTGAVLVGAEADLIDEVGVVTETAPGAIGEHRLVSVEEVLDYPVALIGARLAWRRSALAPFGPFGTSATAVAPDRVLGFRAALAGSVAIACGGLLDNRRHRDNWSSTQIDQRVPFAPGFGGSLQRLSLLRVMERDLRRARELCLVGDADVEALRSLLRAQRAVYLEEALDAHDALVSAGRLALWVDKDELALANRGALIPQLRAQAARTGALVEPAAVVLRSARALRRRARGQR